MEILRIQTNKQKTQQNLKQINPQAIHLLFRHQIKTITICFSAKVLPRKRANLGNQKKSCSPDSTKKKVTILWHVHVFLRQETFLGRCSGHGKLLPTSEGIFSIPSTEFKTFDSKMPAVDFTKMPKFNFSSSLLRSSPYSQQCGLT